MYERLHDAESGDCERNARSYGQSFFNIGSIWNGTSRLGGAPAPFYLPGLVEPGPVGDTVL